MKICPVGAELLYTDGHTEGRTDMAKLTGAFAIFRTRLNPSDTGVAFGKYTLKNFMVVPCINNIQHFNNQLTHTTLKNVALLKHSKISKTAPTCFGLQGNHLQGAKVST